jgi:hypothetical protein
MDAATETANELIGLTEELLRRYARDIDADNLTVRCLVMSEFFLATYSVLLLSVAAGLVAAIGVGLAALFHWLEAKYGPYAAYGLIASLLLILTLIGALAGILLLKKPLPPLPDPRQPVKAAGRAVASETAVTLASAPNALMRANRRMQVMIGLAAACFLGWLVSSRRERER